MVRLAENQRVINPNRYYLWSYVPDNQAMRNTHITPSGKFLYKKRICGVPFYTTLHARRMLYYQLGLESFSEVHIVKGRKLIKEGIKYLDYKQVNIVWYHNKIRHIRKWVTPMDYMLNKHRRRKFRVQMYNYFTKYGKKRFNEELVRIYYGYRPGTTSKHKKFNRFKAYISIIPQVAKALKIHPEDIYIHLGKRQYIGYIGSIDPFTKEGTPEYKAIHQKISESSKQGLMG